MKSIIINKVRVQILSESVIRLELQRNGRFCDDETFLVAGKKNFKGYDGFVVASNGVCKIISLGGYNLYVPEDGKSLSGIYLNNSEGKTVYKYKKTANTGELPPLDKTPEVYPVSDETRIIIPDGGYTYRGDIKDSGYIIEEKVEDVYLLLTGKDARKLRKLYVELTGRCELVRLSTLGSWNSKYYAYTDAEARQLILDYEEKDVPLDVMVIDTDWRAASERGIGYDIDTNLFPDMADFMDFAHSHGVEIMFNDHPEPVEGATSVLSSEEVKFREEKLQSVMEKGLDIWWYDRNWSTHLLSPSPEIKWETFGLYLFEDITRHFYQKQAKSKNYYRRPVIMGNAVNIENGAYRSITDSASHRFSIQWTGDIASDEAALAQEIDNMIKCTNNAIPYINFDCGGHVGNPHGELFVRWMQFGTLSPVFRPHCTKYLLRYREPWVFGEEALNIVREYNKLRYRLLPVLYKNAYESYACGEPICKSLGFEYPNDKKAHARRDEYMIGNDLLVAPVGGECPDNLAAGEYAKPVSVKFFDGINCEGDPIAETEWKTLKMVLDHTSPLSGVPVYNFSAHIETEVMFSADRQLFIRSDDGCTVWVDGEKVVEDKTLHSAALMPLCVAEGGKPHKIVIDYFQAGGEACLELLSGAVREKSEREIYLPAGRWIDLFDGKAYNGPKTFKKQYDLRSMPLFVRAGALLPLAYDAKNTKEQKWNKLVYDFYPCKDAADEGYLYEDDTETTAYKFGEFRKSAHSARYIESENCFEVVLFAGEGKFKGKKEFKTRDITVKYHRLSGADKVKKVTLNGETADFKNSNRKEGMFPLNTEKNAADSSVVNVKFKADTDKKYVVRFYL